MSYCRWSSMGFRCDLYCYEHVDGGWTTHVAGRRRKIPIPEWDTSSAEALAASMAASRAELARQDSLPEEEVWEDVPEIAAGETFNDGTLEEFKARLLFLRSQGYIFPDYVLECVDEEIKEAQAEAAHERPADDEGSVEQGT